MISRHWGFKVYGDPKPKGSMKCVGARGKRKHVIVEDVDDGGWRDLVTAMARKHVLEQAAEHQPVYVEITFSLARPASHYGTGRNARLVKASAPLWPTVAGTGDTDKLARLVLDALQDAAVLRNDAQAVAVLASKAYTDPHPAMSWAELSDVLDRPGAVVRIRPR